MSKRKTALAKVETTTARKGPKVARSALHRVDVTPTRGQPVKAPRAGARLTKPHRAGALHRPPHHTTALPTDQFGFRQGTLKSRAAELYSRKGGATLSEVKTELNTIQFNVLTQLEGKGFKVKRALENGNGNRKITRYHLQT